MVEKLQRRFALSRKGAVDTIKGSLLCALQNISFMLPVCMLYYLVVDMLGGALTASRIPFYAVGTVICAAVILVCTYLQYNSTFLATYVETGVRRISLAEKLRRIPLSFFGKKDLADLTSAIMNDCAVLETSQSHHICPLIGAIISTTLIALSLFIFNWRMALASVWVLPLAFCIVGLAAGVQKKLSAKSMAARLSCEDGIQECMESMPDLRANNAEKRYQGQRDIPLSPAGRAQLRQADLRPETVYITPLCRTRQTAEVLFPGARLVEVKDLQEMCFGSFEGKNYVEMEHDADYQAWVQANCESKCPDGERKDDFSNRICSAFSALVDKALADGEELLVILAHGGTQMAAMERYALPRRGYYAWCGPNAGGYVLDAADWAEKRQLRLVKTVQYTKDAEAGV